MTAAGLRARWRGEAPLGTVFWTEMLLYGTALNAATTLLTLLLLVADVSAVVAVLVHFTPLPVNLFLLVSVWRSADQVGPRVASGIRTAAFLWLIAATML